MSNRCAFNAELGGLMFRNFLGKLAIHAHAEETDPSHEETTPVPSVNFEQMIAQARKEEKDKLYPRIKKAEEENKTLSASVNKYLLENAALKEELEKSKSNKESDSKIKELEDEVSALREENKTLKENTPNEEEIRKKIEAEYEVKLYAEKQIAENKDSILSILIPDIQGATKEEIDSAIASAKEKTLSIKKDLGIADDDEDEEDDEEEEEETTPAPKKKQKRVPPAAPSEHTDNEEFDAETIRNMDPRSPEYAEFRKKMGLK